MISTRNSLPYYTTGFVGRAAEIEQLTAALTPRALPRIVLITGPAGCGKSRLLVESAHRVASLFADGLTYLDLAEIKNPELLIAALARQLDVAEGRPDEPLGPLRAVLRESEHLLLLDNCEHLEKEVAQTVAALASAAPGLVVGIAARHALPLTNARRITVGPLPTPPTENAARLTAAQVGGYASVQLFVERAAAVRSGYELDDRSAGAIAHICDALDGIPLALELAAGQLRAFTPQEIAERHVALGFLPTGQSAAAAVFDLLSARPHGGSREASLRDTIAWSFQLLTAQEQRLLMRLSPFVRSASIEAIEQVACDDDLPRAQLAALLLRLIDKSLVLAESEGSEMRYRLLSVVRAYAEEALLHSGEAATFEARHCAYYGSLAQQAVEGLFTNRAFLWVRTIRIEYGNIQAALERMLDSDLLGAARVIAGLVWFWTRAHRFIEADRWIALLAARGGGPEIVARAAYARGVVNLLNMRYPVAQASFAEAVACAGELKDTRLHSHFLTNLANAALNAGDVATARKALADVAADSFHWQSTWQQRTRQVIEALLHRVDGEQDKALAALAAVVKSCREVDEPIALIGLLLELGRQHALMGDLPAAEAAFREMHDLADQTGNRSAQTRTFFELAIVLQAQGRRSEALDWFEAGLVDTEAQGMRLRVHHLRHLTSMLIAAGEWADGVRLYAAADAAGLEHNVSLPLRYLQERQLAVATAALDPSEVANAQRAGALLTVAAALRLGLDLLRRRLAEAERAGQAALPQLELRLLGMTEVTLNGRVLTNSDWKYIKARDLLFYLVCHGPRTREQIALDLWPDAGAGAARNRLNVTLHFMRRALGSNEWILHESGRYTFVHAGAYVCDADQFADLLAQTDQCVRDDPARAADLLEQAVNLWRGDYLEDITQGEWHEECRRAMRRRMLGALLRLGELRLKLDNTRAAIEAFTRAMVLDPFEEATYQGLMRAHAARKDYIQIMQIFRNMVELFEDEMGAPPGAQTLELYASLVGDLPDPAANGVVQPPATSAAAD